MRKKYHLLEYILPNEDLDDFNILKKNIENIEDYNFKEIISKYQLNDYIILILFKNEDNIRVLSRILLNKNLLLKNGNPTNFPQKILEKSMRQHEIYITIDLKCGKEWEEVFTCDFSYDYVKINAEYTT